MTARCAGTTKSGTPCHWRTWRNGTLCLNCAAVAGDESARVEQAARGARGRAQQTSNNNARKRKICSLRNTADLLTELEHQLIEVERAAGDRVQKAKVAVAIVSEARATLKTAELELENRQLREILLEKHPELRRVLKVVAS
jgi:hypothetical protein